MACIQIPEEFFGWRAIRGIAFDLDGTLIDLNGSYRILSDACKAFSAKPPSIAEIKRLIQSLSLEQIAAYLLKGINEEHACKRKVSAFVDWVHKRYSTYVATYAHLIPGATNCLSQLTTNGYRLSIVSNNDRCNVTSAIEHFDLKTYFTTIVTADDVKKLKPAPEMITMSSKNLNLIPRKQLVVGDSRNDIRAATLAGSPSLGVATGVSSPDELRVEGAWDVLPSVSYVLEKLSPSSACAS